MKIRKMAALELAAKIAIQSDHKQHKLGCVITDRKDNLLSVGFNRFKTHPEQVKYAGQDKPYLHAEISALVKVRESQPYKAYIVRRLSSGRTGLARPCSSCMAALIEAGISPEHIYWSK